ncbi:MAG: hypothetical protein J0M18_09800 [Ignavibacteria bacterium]|nr:hypothetical protein [Ignavibacteria bacterium]
MNLNNHNLIIVLRTITPDELKSLKTFLSSPYFNSLSKINELLEILKKFYPEFNSDSLTSEFLFKKLYPGKIYNYSTITNLISKMQKLIEEFLIISNIQKNPLKKNEFLIKEYFGRNLKSLSSKNIFSFSEEKSSKEDIGSDFFQRSYNFDAYKVNYILNYGLDNHKKSTKILSESLLNVNVNFINYFIMELMSNYINSIISLSSNDTYNIKPKLEKVIYDLEIEKLIKNIEPFNNYTYIINLYLKLVQAFSNLGNVENYYSYKKALFKNKDKLNKNELYFHYSKLIAYCSLQKDKTGNSEFQKEIFEICQIVLDNEYYIYFASKFLPINLYKIIINSAITLEKFDWLENFIKIYSKKVNPRLQKDAENFGLATLNFATGNYRDCLTNLNNIRENTFFLEIRAMKLIIFYNLAYFNEGLNDLKSFQKFIRINKSFTQQRRQTLINFLTYMDKLFLYKISNKKSDMGYYRKKLTIEENCLYKDWLVKTYQKLK